MGRKRLAKSRKGYSVFLAWKKDTPLNVVLLCIHNNDLIMDSKERAVRQREYFIELLNADIPDNLMRREKLYGAKPMISEMTLEEIYKAIGYHNNFKLA